MTGTRWAYDFFFVLDVNPICCSWESILFRKPGVNKKSSVTEMFGLRYHRLGDFFFFVELLEACGLDGLGGSIMGDIFHFLSPQIVDRNRPQMGARKIA